jgi:hypothetical protein
VGGLHALAGLATAAPPLIQTVLDVLRGADQSSGLHAMKSGRVATNPTATNAKKKATNGAAAFLSALLLITEPEDGVLYLQTVAEVRRCACDVGGGWAGSWCGGPSIDPVAYVEGYREKAFQIS